MSFYEKLLDMLERELEQFASKGGITEADAKMVECLTHSIKSIETIMAMREGSGTYSGAYYDAGLHGTSRARARRRDSMGRYSMTGDDMVSELEAIKSRVPEHMRYKFQSMIDELRR